MPGMMGLCPSGAPPPGAAPGKGDPGAPGGAPGGAEGGPPAPGGAPRGPMAPMAAGMAEIGTPVAAEARPIMTPAWIICWATCACWTTAWAWTRDWRDPSQIVAIRRGRFLAWAFGFLA